MLKLEWFFLDSSTEARLLTLQTSRLATLPNAQNRQVNLSKWSMPKSYVPQLMPLPCPTTLLKIQAQWRSAHQQSTTDCYQTQMTVLSQALSSVLRWWDHIVYLEDHLHHLRGKQYLLLLANQSFKDVLLLHVVRANVVAVYATVGITLLQRC